MPSRYFPNDPIVVRFAGDNSAEQPDDSDMPSDSLSKSASPAIPPSAAAASSRPPSARNSLDRGHEVHFISYERPFRLPADSPRIHFHPVTINDYGLFKYPDYTLPLSVKMAEVSRDFGWIFCTCITPCRTPPPRSSPAHAAGTSEQPRVVTTLHGTDTTLLGRDADYGPAIRHALDCSDAVTAVSDFLQRETPRLFGFDRPIDVIHNFCSTRPRSWREDVRRELGIGNETMILHSSNLRPVKRIDLLLETVALIHPRETFKLVILAGEDFSPFMNDVHRLDLEDRVIVRRKSLTSKIICRPPTWPYTRPKRKVFAWAFWKRCSLPARASRQKSVAFRRLSITTRPACCIPSADPADDRRRR